MTIVIVKKGANPPAGEAGKGVTDFMARAVTLDFFPANDLELAAGSLFTEADIMAGRPVIVLGAGLAKRLFPGADPVGAKLRLNGIEFQVIGVLKPYVDPTGEPQDFRFGQDYQGYVPATVAGRPGMLRITGGAVGSLTFAVRDAAKLRPAVNQLTSYFHRKLGPGTVKINTALDWAEQSRREIVPVLAVVGFMAGCGLLIAALNILNLKSHGGQGDQARQGHWHLDRVGRLAADDLRFLSLRIAAPGRFRRTLGSGRGLRPDGTLARHPHPGQAGGPDMTLTWQVLAVAALTTLVVSLVFGVYPACRAARIDPVEALRMD